MNVKSPIQKSAIIIASGLLALAATGCESVQAMLEGMDKPQASVKGVSFDGLTSQSVGLVFDVEVTNPYTVALPLTNLDYSLATSGKTFLSGSAQTAGSVPAKGSKRLSIPATVKFSELLDAAGSIKPGSLVPYKVTMTLSADAPAIGPISLPLSKSGELPIPAVPDVQVTSLKWTKLAFDEAAADMTLNITNTNDFGVDLSSLSYALSLGGSKVADSSVTKAVHFAKGAPAQLTIPVRFSPLNFGIGLFNMLRGSGAAYTINGDMKLTTPFGPIELPYSREGQTLFSNK